MRMAAGNKATGYVLLLLSALSMSFVAYLVKVASRGVPPGEIVFARFAVGLALVGGYALVRGAPRAVNKRDLVLRALFTSGAVLALFHAVALGGMASSVFLLHARPVFIVLLALPYIGERPRARDFAGVAVALTGVMMIVKPGTPKFHISTLLGLAAGLSSAMAVLTVRKLRRTDSSITILLYLMVIGMLCSAPLLARGAVWPDAHNILLLLCIGGLATASQLMLTWSYKMVEAPAGSIIATMAVVFAAGLGYFALGEALDSFVLLGAALILAANVLVTAAKPAQGSAAK